VKLHWLSPENPRAETLERIEELEALPHETRVEKAERLARIAFIDLLNALESCDGPEKWLKLKAYNYLFFYAHDPNQLAKRNEKLVVPQVMIKVRHRYHEIRYELPHEQQPWKWAVAYVRWDETVDLLLDAFTRCESRREKLVTRIWSNRDAE